MNEREAAEHFAVGTITRVLPYGAGLINRTYLVKTTSGQSYIVQKMHGIFAPSVCKDIEAVTTRLRANGIVTPVLIETADGAPCIVTDSAWWRMLSFIPGTTYERDASPKAARSGGSLLGTFHAALTDFDYPFKHRLKGFHDTPRIMGHLKTIAASHSDKTKRRALAPLSDYVLGCYESCAVDWDTLPQRVIHGDPKINNVRFDETGERATALLDLDTLGRGSVVIDVGDAARSWCNTTGEDGAQCRFDLAIFERLIAGYRKTAYFLTQEERAAIPAGIETIILELAARFITDAFEERYFALDTRRHATLYAQNRERAEAQIALHDDFVRKKEQIIGIVSEVPKMSMS